MNGSSLFSSEEIPLKTSLGLPLVRRESVSLYMSCEDTGCDDGLSLTGQQFRPKSANVKICPWIFMKRLPRPYDLLLCGHFTVT
jgi:hypothetical protein